LQIIFTLKISNITFIKHQQSTQHVRFGIPRKNNQTITNFNRWNYQLLHWSVQFTSINKIIRLQNNKNACTKLQDHCSMLNSLVYHIRRIYHPCWRRRAGPKKKSRRVWRLLGSNLVGILKFFQRKNEVWNTL